MQKNSCAMSKDQLLQIIRRQQISIQSLVNERQWLLDDNHIHRVEINKFKSLAFQWQRYAQQDLAVELKQAKLHLKKLKDDLRKAEKDYTILLDKYNNLEVLYFELIEDYEINKKYLQFCLQLGISLYQEYLYYKNEYMNLLKHCETAGSTQATIASKIQKKEHHWQVTQSNTLLPSKGRMRKTSAPYGISPSGITFEISCDSNIFVTPGVVLPLSNPFTAPLSINTISQLLLPSNRFDGLSQFKEPQFFLGAKERLTDKIPQTQTYVTTHSEGDCHTHPNDTIQLSLGPYVITDEVGAPAKLPVRCTSHCDDKRTDPRSSVSEAQGQKNNLVRNEKTQCR